MAEQAQITSVDAIESFRSKLIEYINSMRPALGEVGSEVLRTRVWLQGEHRHYWEHELRLRSRRLEEAKLELFNASLSQLNEAAALHRMAVQRAQRAVREAEAKLLTLKKWSRDIENFTAPLMKQVDQLQGFLASDLARAVIQLEQVLKALEAYRNVTVTRPGLPNPAESTKDGGTP